jgi:hypothetical protein
MFVGERCHVRDDIVDGTPSVDTEFWSRNFVPLPCRGDFPVSPPLSRARIPDP